MDDFPHPPSPQTVMAIRWASFMLCVLAGSEANDRMVLPDGLSRPLLSFFPRGDGRDYRATVGRWPAGPAPGRLRGAHARRWRGRAERRTCSD